MDPNLPLRPAVFLDRDGVLIENHHPYLPSFEAVEYLPGAVAACLALNQAGWNCVVVTNQGASIRNGMSIDDVESINGQIIEGFTREGVTFLDVRYCPHNDIDGCHCRKPKPGMLLDSARAHGIDLSRSFMVGDAITDLYAAQSAGAQGILVRTGRGRDQEAKLTAIERERWPVVDDLHAAANLIIGRSESQ